MIHKIHYFDNYDTKERWISYWHQISEVLKTNPKNVLEVGVGNKTVANYLENQGVEIVTADINKDLNPSYVCSVDELSSYCKENFFDTVLCAEVLEHLPFEKFEKALEELKKVAKNNLIISLPYFGINFSFIFKASKIKEKNISFKIPCPINYNLNPEHYWEIGRSGYSFKKIKKILEKQFTILKIFKPIENPYHIFFVLKK